MRKRNTKTTVPLDVVPERRTERFPPRFRPVGRFCELRFRYLSSPTGREGEISRPLDHMRQIPFIHSARLIESTNFYIYRTVFQIFCPCGALRKVLMQSIFNNCERALARTQISRLRPSCCFSYGTLWGLLVQNRWHLRMRIVENIKQSILSFYFIRVFLCLFLCPFFFYSKQVFFLVL